VNLSFSIVFFVGLYLGVYESGRRYVEGRRDNGKEGGEAVRQSVLLNDV